LVHGRQHDHRRWSRRPVRARSRAPVRSLLDAPRRVDARLPAAVARSLQVGRTLHAAVRIPFHWGQVVSDPAVTYSNYLKVDELLALQQPRSPGPEHDEMLFIVIHQVYELWFKELLHELDRVRALLVQDEPHRTLHTFKRILTILKVMVAQLDILETMTPLEFLSFRERLEAGSGFQSDQFRQLEFLLGVKSEQVIGRFPDRSRARIALERRYREPTVWDAFLRYLIREGYGVADV